MMNHIQRRVYRLLQERPGEPLTVVAISDVADVDLGDAIKATLELVNEPSGVVPLRNGVFTYSLRRHIAIQLALAGGAVECVSGRATLLLCEGSQFPCSRRTLSRVLHEMEADQQVERKVDAKKCYRIAVTDQGLQEHNLVIAEPEGPPLLVLTPERGPEPEPTFVVDPTLSPDEELIRRLARMHEHVGSVERKARQTQTSLEGQLRRLKQQYEAARDEIVAARNENRGLRQRLLAAEQNLDEITRRAADANGSSERAFQDLERMIREIPNQSHRAVV